MERITSWLFSSGGAWTSLEAYPDGSEAGTGWSSSTMVAVVPDLRELCVSALSTRRSRPGAPRPAAGRVEAAAPDGRTRRQLHGGGTVEREPESAGARSNLHRRQSLTIRADFTCISSCALGMSPLGTIHASRSAARAIAHRHPHRTKLCHISAWIRHKRSSAHSEASHSGASHSGASQVPQPEPQTPALPPPHATPACSRAAFASRRHRLGHGRAIGRETGAAHSCRIPLRLSPRHITLLGSQTFIAIATRKPSAPSRPRRRRRRRRVAIGLHRTRRGRLQERR